MIIRNFILYWSELYEGVGRNNIHYGMAILIADYPPDTVLNIWRKQVKLSYNLGKSYRFPSEKESCFLFFSKHHEMWIFSIILMIKANHTCVLMKDWLGRHSFTTSKKITRTTKTMSIVDITHISTINWIYSLALGALDDLNFLNMSENHWNQVCKVNDL